jgi:hypothetical protein
MQVRYNSIINWVVIKIGESGLNLPIKTYRNGFYVSIKELPAILEKPSSRDNFEAKYELKKCTSKEPTNSCQKTTESSGNTTISS